MRGIKTILMIPTAAVLLLAGALGGGLFWAINGQIQLDQEYFLYVGEGTSTAGERLRIQGLMSIWGTYQQSGFFGEGLGSASTGARFGGARGIKTWQESGTAKVMVELGVIGFVASIMLGITILKWIFQLLTKLRSQISDAVLFIGLLGVLGANAASFVISHQVFGDPFIVTMTGFFIGLALSAPRWLGSTNPITNAKSVDSVRPDGQIPKFSPR